MLNHHICSDTGHFLGIVTFHRNNIKVSNKKLVARFFGINEQSYEYLYHLFKLLRDIWGTILDCCDEWDTRCQNDPGILEYTTQKKTENMFIDYSQITISTLSHPFYLNCF